VAQLFARSSVSFGRSLVAQEKTTWLQVTKLQLFKQLKRDNTSSVAFPDSPNDLYHDWYLGLAYVVRGKCDDTDTKVGCVIVKNHVISSIGYNGYRRRVLEADRFRDDGNQGTSKKFHVIHAEQNAFQFRWQDDIDGSTLYVTRAPCWECCPLVQQFGLSEVRFSALPLRNEYKKSLMFLRMHGIKLFQKYESDESEYQGRSMTYLLETNDFHDEKPTAPSAAKIFDFKTVADSNI